MPWRFPIRQVAAAVQPLARMCASCLPGEITSSASRRSVIARQRAPTAARRAMLAA